MEALYTIGYERKSLERFITLLREAEVDAVVDIRLNNRLQLAGFAKGETLAFLLPNGFHIDYLYAKELAPTREILARFQRERDWAAYELEFRALMAERGMVGSAVSMLESYRRPCLLCFERWPDECHRRLLAEEVQAAVAGLPVCHLLD